MMDGFFYVTGFAFWACAAFATIWLAIEAARDFVVALIFARCVIPVLGWKAKTRPIRKAITFVRIAWHLFIHPCDSVHGPNGVAHHPRSKREVAG